MCVCQVRPRQRDVGKVQEYTRKSTDERRRGGDELQFKGPWRRRWLESRQCAVRAESDERIANRPELTKTVRSFVDVEHGPFAVRSE